MSDITLSHKLSYGFRTTMIFVARCETGSIEELEKLRDLLSEEIARLYGEPDAGGWRDWTFGLTSGPDVPDGMKLDKKYNWAGFESHWRFVPDTSKQKET